MNASTDLGERHAQNHLLTLCEKQEFFFRGLILLFFCSNIRRTQSVHVTGRKQGETVNLDL